MRLCVGLHTGALQKQNETAERIGEVVDWRGSEVYTQRERAALWLGRCADRHAGGARSGCGVRRGAGALFRGGDGEPDAGDYDDQCMEPDCDWAGSARGAAVTIFFQCACDCLSSSANIRGSLYCAADDETVRCFGWREDVLHGVRREMERLVLAQARFADRWMQDE